MSDQTGNTLPTGLPVDPAEALALARRVLDEVTPRFVEGVGAAAALGHPAVALSRGEPDLARAIVQANDDHARDLQPEDRTKLAMVSFEMEVGADREDVDKRLKHHPGPGR